MKKEDAPPSDLGGLGGHGDSSSVLSQSWNVGDRVEARWMTSDYKGWYGYSFSVCQHFVLPLLGNPHRHPGRIGMVHDDGLYTIEYDDG